MENQNAPTIKPGPGGIRFYNAGDRFSEPIRYSLPNGSDIHCVASYVIDAAEKDFFLVPTSLRLLSDNTNIAIDFHSTICQKFKDRGVIMIDPDWEPTGDDDLDDAMPFARDDNEAKKKGERIWRKYLIGIVNRWKTLCQELRQKGHIPDEAQGFTKRALRLLGVKDPAVEHVEVEESKTGSTAEVAGLREMIEAQNRKIELLMQSLEAQRQAKADEKLNEQIEARTTNNRSNRRNS